MAINGGGLIGISILDGSIGLVLEQPGIFMLLGFRSDIFFSFLYTVFSSSSFET